MRHKLLSLAIAILGIACSGIAVAHSYIYSGEVTECLGTCVGFDALEVGSTIDGVIEIDTTPGGSFGDAEVQSFLIEVYNPGLPPSGPIGDPVTDNPLVIDSLLGVAASNGTAGTTDAGNEINGGQMLLEFLVPPFDVNEAYIVFDLTTGNGQICLFYATAGCIPGATEAMKFEGTFTLLTPDSDNDGVDDSVDNCTNEANPAQRDTDGDGHGNLCDADLNDDCIVNVIDLGLLRSVFFSTDPDADFNGDGGVNVIDLGIFKTLFFLPPGPSADPALCN